MFVHQVAYGYCAPRHSIRIEFVMRNTDLLADEISWLTEVRQTVCRLYYRFLYAVVPQ